MKGLLIVGVVLCIALSVRSQNGPTLHPYPTVFSASFSENTYVFQQEIIVKRDVFFDLPNKRATITYATDRGQETWTLVYKPEGADPNTPAGQGYTLFRIKSDSCMYTARMMLQAPFPRHWNKAEWGYRLEVSPWFDLPADLVYNGDYYIPDLHEMSDRWDTTKQCDLPQLGMRVPCASVMYSQDQHPLPLSDVRAFQNDGNEDNYVVRTYASFNTTVHDSDFALPDNWLVNCDNVDNNFVTKPVKPVTVYSDGEQSAPLTIELATPPIAELGDVKVVLVRKNYWFLNCADCVDPSPNGLIFTQDNWNVSQPMPLTYKHSGCSGFGIQATGGGYEFVYWMNLLGVISCEGDSHSGCHTPNKCNGFESEGQVVIN